MLLEGGLDWKPLSMSPKDMDFVEAIGSAPARMRVGIGSAPARMRVGIGSAPARMRVGIGSAQQSTLKLIPA